MIELSGVKVAYGTGKAQVRALDGLDLVVEKGDILAVTGPSGSGKTTLLNVVSGLVTPTAGRVVVDGADLPVMSSRARAAFRLDRIGIVFQMFRLVDYLTALENVMVPMYLAKEPSGEARARAAELLKILGMEGRASHRPSELSAGECQRVAIARALARKPSILLADEPTGNLDEESGRGVLAALREASAEGCTVLLVTHDWRAAEYASKSAALRDGMIAVE